MKKQKVFYMGQRLKDIYPYATKWEVIKFKVRKFLEKVLLVIVIGLVIAGIVQYFRVMYPTTIYNVRETKVEVDNLTGKIEDLKSDVLDSLKSCESQGAKESDGLIVFDSNKKASIGLYQFQVLTVVHYYKTLYGKDITKKEAIVIALDEKLSRQLANDIIFQDSKGVDNWFNCKNKKGLSENIKWINKISQ